MRPAELLDAKAARNVLLGASSSLYGADRTPPGGGGGGGGGRPSAGESTAAQRRIHRIRQVRAQEAAFSSRLVREYESKKAALERDAVDAAATSWQRGRAARETQLRTDLSAAMGAVGHSHAAARDDAAAAEDQARQQYWAFVRCRGEDERRYAEALSVCREEKLDREKPRIDMVERRHLVLAIEKQRAEEAAALAVSAQRAAECADDRATQGQACSADMLVDYTSTHMHNTRAVKRVPVELSARDAAQLEMTRRENARLSAEDVETRRRDDAQARGNMALVKLRSERVRTLRTNALGLPVCMWRWMSRGYVRQRNFPVAFVRPALTAPSGSFCG